MREKMRKKYYIHVRDKHFHITTLLSLCGNIYAFKFMFFLS